MGRQNTQSSKSRTPNDPSPTMKPLHLQLEEAQLALDSMMRYGPDEDETQLSWSRRAKSTAEEIQRLNELIRDDTECAGCKEIFPADELDKGVCESCWMKLSAVEAREER